MATKISKSLTRSIANQLVANTLGKKRQELDEKLKKALMTLVISSLPEEVISFSKKYSKFVSMGSAVRLRLGADTFIHSVDSFPSDLGWVKEVEIFDKKIFDNLLRMHRRYEDYYREIREAEKATYETLVNLGTFKRIQEVFPEAYALIPEETFQSDTQALAIPMSTLREKLGL